jgi:hypothetical protein
MKPIQSNLSCPSCQGPLAPKVLGCDACGIEVRGPFVLNEFATLDPEDLRLLRIFVLAEGRVRDMEAPLGLSYPTIRNRLAALREKLQPDASAPVRNSVPPASSTATPRDVDTTLDLLKAGEVSFDEALEAIRKRRPKKDESK